MVKVYSILPLLACALHAAAASISSRTPGGVFLCDQVNFTGTCGFAVQPLNTCIVLGDDWNNKITSLGPDDRNAVIAFNTSDCSGLATAFVFPGSPNLANQGIDDSISSFIVLGY